jgi:hypothetical protein
VRVEGTRGYASQQGGAPVPKPRLVLAVADRDLNHALVDRPVVSPETVAAPGA